MSGRVVAIGGGHGLAASLRAIRRYSTDITAIVSVADDGGSTGRLRGATQMPAPGDIRKCLTALAGTDAPIVAALEHRFTGGDVEGHALGNLVLAALTAEIGDPLAAIAEVGRLVGAVGRVLPAASEPVTLVGATADGTEIRGQVAVMRSGGVRSVWVDPIRPRVSAEVGAAILTADQVVIGPGSLYTSVLAATAVDEVRDALHDTSAQKVYVCNLRPQEPETAG